MKGSKIAASAIAIVLMGVVTPALGAPNSYVYVNNFRSPNSVSAFAVDATGNLTVVPGSAFLTGGTSSGTCFFLAAERATVVAVSNRLFVSNASSTGATISGFNIDPSTGALTLIAGSPFRVTSDMQCSVAVAASADGRFLAASTNGRVHMFAIDVLTGALSPVAGSPFVTGADNDSLGMSYDGKFLTLAQTSGRRLETHSITEGVVGPASSINQTSSPATNAEYSCDGTRLLAGTSGSMLLFAVSATGTLTQLATAAGLTNAQTVTFSLGDKYAFGSTGAQIGSFAITGNTLVPVAGSPVSNPGGAAARPFPLVTSGDGKFLFVMADRRLNTFSIGPDGSLAFAGFASTPGTLGGVAAYPGKTCDSEPPVTTLSVDVAPNAAGWNRSDVTVTLSASDGDIGSGVKEIHYTLSGAQTAAQVVSADVASFVISAEGVTEISYFAVDNAGNQESPTTYTVRIDKTPPAITACSVNPATLWPPNHKLVPVTVTVAFADPVSSVAGVILDSASSSETDDGPGDGDTRDDIQGFAVGSDKTSGWLRAERGGKGSGRLYTLTYEAVDAAGNVAACTVTVAVPHDARR